MRRNRRATYFRINPLPGFQPSRATLHVRKGAIGAKVEDVIHQTIPQCDRFRIRAKPTAVKGRWTDPKRAFTRQLPAANDRRIADFYKIKGPKYAFARFDINRHCRAVRAEHVNRISQSIRNRRTIIHFTRIDGLW